MTTMFDGDDTAYQEWLTQNPTGVVLNSWRAISPSYMVLHRAYCPTVRPDSGITKPGGFTERKYIKICAAEVADLRHWVRQHGRTDGSFSVECSKCSGAVKDGLNVSYRSR